MRARIARDISLRTQNPKEKLLAVFEVFGELLALDGFRGCPFINASAEFASEDNPVQRASAEFYEGFRHLLAEIADRAGAKDPDELARQLTLLIAGAIVTEQMKRDSGAMSSARRAAEALIENSV